MLERASGARVNLWSSGVHTAAQRSAHRVVCMCWGACLLRWGLEGRQPPRLTSRNGVADGGVLRWARAWMDEWVCRGRAV